MRIRIIGLTILLAGCAPTQHDVSTRDASGVSIIQNGHTVSLYNDINKPNEITLKKGNFIIEAPAIPGNVAVQVCASNEDNALESFKRDRSIDQNNCFSPGTGLAIPYTDNPKSGIPLIITDGLGHNYYSADRRVNETLKTSIYIHRIKQVKIIESEQSLLVIVIDKNKDHIVQDGEIWATWVKWQ